MKVLDVYNQDGKKVDKIELSEKIFDGKVAETLMHQAVVTFLSNQRKGLASSKKRGEVRGGGRKPWRQKGTGRARVGSTRSPLWHGGGVTFGPKPRDYNKKITQRMKVIALKSALNAKFRDEEIVLIDKVSLDNYKTRVFSEIMGKLKLKNHKVTLVVGKIDNNLKLASRNIAGVCLEKAAQLNTYTALNCSKLIFTRDSIKIVEERISKWLS
ncbi:MAG: 50S ribosomal protein L4 [Candidatus Omnitrophica bacterium 4484_171]|nr:MAG: 50S ribosomal protein L4 [Candidatus Omnitrophica bacterium 4484_171]